MKSWTRTVWASLLCGIVGCAGSGAGDPKAGPADSALPYGSKPHAIPGTVEAEQFDEGPAGAAYHDLDPENQGAPYRKTSVDVEARPDASGGHGVGWTKAGEWLVYTVEVAKAGSYTVEIPVASAGKGGSFHIEFDEVDKTGPIQVPDTGSWQKLQVISKGGITLRAGRQSMRVEMDSEGETKSVGDMDFFKFSMR